MSRCTVYSSVAFDKKSFLVLPLFMNSHVFNKGLVSYWDPDFHVTCGAQHAGRNQVEVRCSKLDEADPPITAISYSINGGSPTTGRSTDSYYIFLCKICNYFENDMTALNTLTAFLSA